MSWMGFGMESIHIRDFVRKKIIESFLSLAMILRDLWEIFSK